jgi:ABC-type dipeptide/oligopeptide/nickel transport system permease subunit
MTSTSRSAGESRRQPPDPRATDLAALREAIENASSVPLTAEAREPRLRGFWADALRRLLQNRLSVAGLTVLAFYAVVAIAAPLIATHDPNAQDFAATFTDPNSEHLMGTDNLGRDWFSRLVYGARLSVTVGFLPRRSSC